MQDSSCVCNLHHSSRQHHILNPLSVAREQNCILMVTSQINFLWAMMATPQPLGFWASSTLVPCNKYCPFLHHNPVSGEALLSTGKQTEIWLSDSNNLETSSYDLTCLPLLQFALNGQEWVSLSWRWLIWCLSGCIWRQISKQQRKLLQENPQFRIMISKVRNKFFHHKPLIWITY